MAGRRLVTRDSLGLGRSTAGDRFGAALGIVETDPFAGPDVCVVLAVGAPGAAGTGAVDIVYGLASTGGFATAQEVRLPQAAAGNEFGASLATKWGLIVAGAPARDVDGATDAGAVGVIRSATLEDPLVLEAVITQGSRGVAGSPERGDRFGEVLSVIHEASPGTVATLVGVPREDVGRARDAGMVEEIFLDASRTGSYGRELGWTQDSRLMPGVVESGDQFGASLVFAGDPIAIGSPGEDVGGIRDAGSVTFMQAQYRQVNTGNVTSFRPRFAITQSSPRVPGRNEARDQFGAAVSAAAFCERSNSTTLAIGAPAEDVGRRKDAGAVVLYDSGIASRERPARCPSVSVQQGSGALGSPESGDRFGTRLARGSRGLDVTTPGEDLSGNKIIDAGVIDTVVSDDFDSPPSQRTLVSGPVTGLRYGVLRAWCGSGC